MEEEDAGRLTECGTGSEACRDVSIESDEEAASASMASGADVHAADAALSLPSRVEWAATLVALADALVEHHEFDTAQDVLYDELRDAGVSLDGHGHTSTAETRYEAAAALVNALEATLKEHVQRLVTTDGATEMLPANVMQLEEALEQLRAVERNFEDEERTDLQCVTSVLYCVRDLLLPKRQQPVRPPDQQLTDQQLTDRPLTAAPRTRSIISTALKGLTDEDFNAISGVGGDAVDLAKTMLQVLSVAEFRRLSWLQRATSLPNNEGDAKLRSFCVALAPGGSSMVDPFWIRPSFSPDISAGLLEGLSKQSQATTMMLGVDVRHAFAASVAAYAGDDVSPGWLHDRFGATAGYTLVKYVPARCGVCSILLRHGQCLYVATAGALSWNQWVKLFAGSVQPIDNTSCSEGWRFPTAQSGRCVVNRDVWDKFVKQAGALVTPLRDAVNDSQPGAAVVNSVVFCGHGLGAAVAQLLAAAWDPSGRSSRPVRTLVTFGCPAIGDIGFQARLSGMTRHLRLFVDHDPIAGLPFASCDGLRLAPNVRQYSSVQADQHWALSRDGRASKTCATSPSVLSLSVAGVAFASHHSLGAYAECLACHFCGVAADAVLSAARNSSTPSMRNPWPFAPSLVSTCGDADETSSVPTPPQMSSPPAETAVSEERSPTQIVASVDHPDNITLAILR